LDSETIPSWQWEVEEPLLPHRMEFHGLQELLEQRKVSQE